MRIHISPTKLEPALRPIELVERKGSGHPDTLSDALGEHLSRAYSHYTLDRFGAILRHQFDKVSIMCGRAKVAFGGGELIEPIRILVNGRASARLGSEDIPVKDLLLEATYEFFRARFPMLDIDRDLRIIWEVRSGIHTTTGGIFGAPDDISSASARIHYRFHPRSLADLPETHMVESNDTSAAVAWSPYSPLEKTVLSIDNLLSGPTAKTLWPWIGSDIKILATRHKDRVSIVVAVPLLSALTPSAEAYFERLKLIAACVRELFADVAPHYRLDELILNSGDDIKARKLYMNLTGSSIESGDEGMVGRGNRFGGLIASCRPFAMEGLGGKNPRYHVGKVYSAAAFDIATHLQSKRGISSNVYLVNRMAQPLSTPWFAAVETAEAAVDRREIVDAVEAVLSDLERVTASILKGEYPLF